jgi:hypothetical protein
LLYKEFRKIPAVRKTFSTLPDKFNLLQILIIKPYVKLVMLLIDTSVLDQRLPLIGSGQFASNWKR